MAITTAQLQAALGTNPLNAQVVMASEPSQGTGQQWYVAGNLDAVGRVRWVTTLASDNAATQAAAVLTALRAS